MAFTEANRKNPKVLREGSGNSLIISIKSTKFKGIEKRLKLQRPLERFNSSGRRNKLLNSELKIFQRMNV